MRSLTPRDLVVELLRTLVEAENGWQSGSNGGGPRLLPNIYNEGSYAELERRLDEMRDDERWRNAWWHVTHRYWWGRVVDPVVEYRRTIKGPQPKLPTRTELLFIHEITGRQMRIRCYTWSERVNPGFVEAGLDRLLATMYDGDTTRIQLPREFLYLALGKELPDGQPRTSKLSPTSLTVATSSR